MTTQIAPQGLNHEVRAFAIDHVRIERRDESDTLRLSGYAAVFDKPTNIAGMFDEVIRHGAFRNAIATGQDVALLYNHNPDTVMARTTNGTLKLREDDTGLYFEADLDPRDSDAQRVVAKVERGNVSQGSFAFEATVERWNYDERDIPLREILDTNLYDVSPVTYPAYADTSVHARGRVVEPPTPPAQEGDAAQVRQESAHRQRQIQIRRYRAGISKGPS